MEGLGRDGQRAEQRVLPQSPVPKSREQDGRGDIDPGTREWWERLWTDALKRLKRYLEET
jgi:hypothetical protein